MSDLSRNAAFDNVDDLLDATMDDLDGLPPLAIPPSGNYTLEITVERKEVSGKDALVTSYKVIGIGEVDDDSEASEVVVGQLFQNGTYTKKKDGSPNEFGIAAFKDSLVPFATHFFGDDAKTTRIGEVISRIQAVTANVTLKRTQRKGGDDDQYNFRIKSLIVL